MPELTKNFSWVVVHSGPESAESIMRRDKQLLDDLQDQPILHFYEWQDLSATCGYFLNPDQILLSKEGLDLARRPTGGGLLFHVSDLAFSVLVPSTHPSFDHQVGSFTKNYLYINTLVTQAVRRLFPADYTFLQASEQKRLANCCMVFGAKYDVVVGDKKIIGAAQRTKKQGYLHQGTISLGLPNVDFLKKYTPPSIAERMLQYTYAPLGYDYTPSVLKQVRKQLQDELVRVFQQESIC